MKSFKIPSNFDVLKDFNLTFLVGLSFETLATRAYSLAITNGDASHSSTIALTIIATGTFVLLFSHFFLERQLKKELRLPEFAEVELWPGQ